MRKGDVLVCTELSRLGRNMMMVMGILNTCSQRGIQIRSIKDNFELSDSLNSKIIAFAFSLAAEIERNLISQRTREALAAKRTAGIRLAEGRTIRELARGLKMHPNTLSRYLKEKGGE